MFRTLVLGVFCLGSAASAQAVCPIASLAYYIEKNPDVVVIRAQVVAREAIGAAGYKVTVNVERVWSGQTPSKFVFYRERRDSGEQASTEDLSRRIFILHPMDPEQRTRLGVNDRGTAYELRNCGSWYAGIQDEEIIIGDAPGYPPGATR